MEPDTSHDLDLVAVFEAIGAEAEMEAIAIRSMLEASSIPAIIVGSSSLPNLPFQVRVPQELEDTARQRIADAKAAGPLAADEAHRVVIARAPGLIASSVPILPSLQLDESIAYYRQIGFILEGSFEDQYAILSRDGMEIHLNALDNTEVSENSGCYIRTPDVGALHAEFNSAGVERMSDIEEKPWGMLEFEATDPSGNTLHFGQHLPKA